MKPQFVLITLCLTAAAFACTREAPPDPRWNPSDQGLISTPCPSGVTTTGDCLLTATPTTPWFYPSPRPSDAPILSPTPDPPKILPTIRSEPSEYTVQPGDSLAGIASRYNVSYEAIAAENELEDPNMLSAGQFLLIPAPTPSGKAPALKIIPDSELIYGPMSTTLAMDSLIAASSGYLKEYTEEVDGVVMSGAAIIDRISLEYSVNPRLLLAVLEYQGQWLSDPDPSDEIKAYPLGYIDERRIGLYKQLAWAANNLNRGFYLWQINAVPAWLLSDGSMIPPDPTVNAGTAAVHGFFALLNHGEDWEYAVGENGLIKTYQELFGYPFDLGVENLLPTDLQQPTLQLPFEPQIEWSFTGGPHGGWGDGSAWAGLDFAPPGLAIGCVESDDWVTAAADGLITVSQNGMVLEDLDSDGLPQTGWVLVYLHLESRDRIAAGTRVKTGDRLGHPSCEGGVTNGTHVHIARRYNGYWISADGPVPFDLGGWVSTGAGAAYDGYLNKNGISIEAWDGRRPENQIKRD